MRRSLALVLAACVLSLLVLPLPTWGDAHPVVLQNPQGGVLEGADNSYTLTVTGSGLATVDMVVRDLSYSNQPSYTLVIEENLDGILNRAIPIGAQLTGNTTKTLELYPGEGSSGQATLRIYFQYGGGGATPPASIALRVVRQESGGTPSTPASSPEPPAVEESPAAQEPPAATEPAVVEESPSVGGSTATGGTTSVPATTAPADDSYSLLTDPLNPPEVSISGNEARLTYRPRQLVSFGGTLQTTSLTIHDISRLQPDTPLSLAEAGLDLALPAAHVNTVLQAKADDLAAGQLAGLWVVEADALLQEEHTAPQGTLLLTTTGGEALDADCTVFCALWPAVVDEEGRLLFYAEVEDLTALFVQAETVQLELELSYKGIPAAGTVAVLLDLTMAADFPSLYGEDGVELSLPAEGEGAGEAVEGEGLASSIQDVISVSGVGVNLVQSYQNGRYAQKMADNLVFYSSIPAGMITDGPVRLDIPQDFTVTVTRDDGDYQFLRGVDITRPGSYRVMLQAMGEGEYTEDELYFFEDDVQLFTVYEAEFYFRILDEEVGNLPFYNAPQGFRIESVRIDGAAIEGHPQSYYHLQRDGDFRIEIVHRQDPEQRYTVEFSRNTQAPVLFLEGVEPGQSTSKAVRFQASRTDAEITVVRDGSSLTVYQNTVSDPGYYTVQVRDPAGNTTRYSFRILYSLNVSAWTAFALLFLLAAAVGGYAFYLRGHMKTW